MADKVSMVAVAIAQAHQLVLERILAYIADIDSEAFRAIRERCLAMGDGLYNVGVVKGPVSHDQAQLAIATIESLFAGATEGSAKSG